MSILGALNDALDKMTWLTDSDGATVALARHYAEQIDDATEMPDPLDTARVVKLLGPELAAAIRDLGGTPGTRRAIGAEVKQAGRLAELRAARE